MHFSLPFCPQLHKVCDLGFPYMMTSELAGTYISEVKFMSDLRSNTKVKVM